MLLRYISLLLLTVFGMLPSIGFSMIGTPIVATDASGKESGLTYAKARYYNPAIGRFYAPDPIAFRENDLTSINRYVYGSNNPYKYVDPTGMEPMFGDPDWDTVNGWGAVNNAYNQVGYGLDTYKGEIAAVAGGVGVASYYGGAILAVAAKETVSELASQYTNGLSDFLSFTKLGKTIAKRSKATKGADETVDVFRVFGGDARAQGFSFTTVDPRKVKNFRDAAGLPSGGASGATNSADFLIKGTANVKDIIKSRSALPLDGNKGGLPELIIDPKNVKITDFSVIKP